MSFLQSVTDFYLGLPGVIQWLLAIAWPIVFYYGYDYWRYSRSDMRSTMVFSLNKLMVVDHQRAYLQFYTLSYVENFRSFLPNRYLRFRFNQAIDQTNETDPIIRLDAKYGNLIYPSMFNLMSSQFGDGFFENAR